jgi:radical SAM superfamily enzyme YgiQ (UPF0313 family)
MKLLLIFPSWCSTFGVFKHVAKKASSFPPLGFCYMASLAQQIGWQVKIIDDEVEAVGVDGFIQTIEDFQPDLIGLTATTPFFHTTAQVARHIKRHCSVPIVLGGAHASLAREEAFLDCFDYLFIGECEGVLQAWLKEFETGTKTFTVKGLMFRQDGKITFNGEAPKVQDLDTLPWPDRTLVPYKRYCVGTLQGTKNYTSFFMSRGCPFNCVFCASKLHGRRVRRRNVAEIVKEIDHIVNTLKIEHIYFLDDTLTLNRQYIMDFCDAVEAAGLRFTFEGSTRANVWDEALVRRLKACGLIRISFGLEAVDPDVRKIIKKEVPIQSYIEANRLNKKLGIETINSVMLGLPGENEAKIRQTVDFLCKAKDIQHATYGIAIPYPGTEMREMALKGQHGLRLLDEDYSHYQRYGTSVMEVGGLQPDEIIDLQKKGLIRIYTCWWRIWPIIKRHGVRALIVPVWDAISSVARMGVKKVTSRLRKPFPPKH